MGGAASIQSNIAATATLYDDHVISIPNLDNLFDSNVYADNDHIIQIYKDLKQSINDEAKLSVASSSSISLSRTNSIKQLARRQLTNNILNNKSTNDLKRNATGLNVLIDPLEDSLDSNADAFTTCVDSSSIGDRHVGTATDSDRSDSNYSNNDITNNGSNNLTDSIKASVKSAKVSKLKVQLDPILFFDDFESDDVKIDGNGNCKHGMLHISPKGTLSFGEFKIQSNNRNNNTLYTYTSTDFLDVGKLGHGASGVIYEALHLPTFTIVALKTLPVYNQEKRREVARELQVLYNNMHEISLLHDSLDDSRSNNGSGSESVVQMYSAFVDPKTGFISLVIEYMNGGSLQDLVMLGGCQDENILKDIAFQALQGLSYLHTNKSVHRDIKPANILCSSSGKVKIADFGISIVLENTKGFAKSFVGTFCYMSPERINGEQYSFSSDVWSFGLTLLAVAFGRFPLSQESTNAGYWGMIKMICDEDPPVPGDGFSAEFNSFIASCLCKNPDERSTVDQLLQSSFLADVTHGSSSSLPSPMEGLPHLRKKSIDITDTALSIGRNSNNIDPPPAASIVDLTNLDHLENILDRLELHAIDISSKRADGPSLPHIESPCWINLASQLRLPIAIVKLLVKAKMDKYISKLD